MCQAAAVVGALGVLLGAVSLAAGQDTAAARAALEKAGVRASSSGATLVQETALTKELGKALALRRNLTQAQKDLQAVEQQTRQLQAALNQMRVQSVQLNAELANVGPTQVTLNNRLVGMLNALQGQMQLGEERQKALEETAKRGRARANEAREAYVQFVLDARRLANEIEANYAKLATDPAVKQALATLGQAAGKSVALAPTSSLQASLRRLQQLEDGVLSDSIDLRDDGGKTLYVSVVVNGKHTQEMILDSGASLISLPAAVAATFGLQPGPQDPPIFLQLADGRVIRGRRMKLASVRVGRFTLENVDCAVLGEEASSAEPLLGMSFLEHFTFEIDAAARKLTMVRVSTSDAPAKSSK